MRHSDRPITQPSEDALGRSEFALALAQAIDQLLVAKHGFVIGLIGEWGSGKSSVVELTLRFLRHKEMALMHAGKDQEISLSELDVMSERFARIEPVITSLEAENRDATLWERTHRDREFLRLCGSAEDAEIASQYWALLRKVQEKPRNIVVRFSPWLIARNAELASALISDLARASGEALGEEVRNAFTVLLSRLAQVTPLAGAAVDIVGGGGFGGLFSAGMDISDRLAKRMTTGPTLDQVRLQLRKTLGSLVDQKIVVVVDDLDRLTPPEAAEMVALVKGLGDLPNVVYILCYDEDRLAGLLKTALGIDGGDYLQKIVQYPVHLPPVEVEDLAALLDADIRSILPEIEDETRSRVGNAWFAVLQNYLRTPRDVRRLMNAYSVAIAGLSDHTDPVDLLLIEAIRLHEPDIYTWIRRNLGNITQGEEEDEDSSLIGDLEVHLAKTQSRGPLEAALALLFSKLAAPLGVHLSGLEDDAESNRSYRIANRDSARSYFRLTPDANVWSKTFVESIKASEPQVALAKLASLLEHADDKDRTRFQSRILTIAEDVMSAQNPNLAEWFGAIVDKPSIFMDERGWETAPPFTRSFRQQASIVIESALLALPLERRARILERTIRSARDISLLSILVRTLARDVNPQEPYASSEALGGYTNQIRDLLLKRVRVMARDGSLLGQYRPSGILWFWWGAGQVEAVRRFTEVAMDSKAGLPVLLRMPISLVKSTAGNYERIDRADWQNLLDLDRLEMRAMLLAHSEDPENEAIAQRYIAALHQTLQ